MAPMGTLQAKRTRATTIREQIPFASRVLSQVQSMLLASTQPFPYFT
jgi:hypothetical protein